jgi:undecaprenyl diphosphate synthase
MHLAIIMDGNGRWATQKGLSRLEGHKKGSETLKNISLYCSEKKRNIDYLSVYAFSVQNWGRPKEEIFSLFSLIKSYFNDIELFNKRNIRIRTQGYIEIYPKDILDTIKNAVNITKNNTGLTLTIVLSYGGREEIVDAVNEMIIDGFTNINMNNLSSYIEKDKVPNPDLIIRTSGEFRTSNFLLWQSAYSEYLFTDIYWPDFTEKELDNALTLYSKRSRRFGLVDPLTRTLPNALSNTNALPTEDHCRFFIEQIINKRQQYTSRVDRYKEKSLLRSKYFNIINNMLLENTLTDAPEIVAKEAEQFGRKLIPNKPESFYTHINTWTEWIFLTDNIIDENNLKNKNNIELKNINLDDLTIVDMHKLFRKYIKSAETEETLKTKMFELNARDISLYRCILRNDIKSDYISRIIVFFYIIFPILEDILTTDMICLIAIMSTILDDIEDCDNEIPLDIYQVLESVLISFEQNDSIQVNNSITIKMKTSLIYLILFSLQRTETKNDKKITFSMLFNYLQMLF